MNKKSVALLLAVAMIVGTFAGCGAKDPEPSKESQTTEKSEETAKEDSEVKEEVKEEPPVELTALATTHVLTQDLQEIAWLNECAEEANVTVTWEQIRDGWWDMKNTRLASGDVPDIMYNAVNGQDFNTYKGLFVELGQYISPELTPNIYEMFEEEPEMKKLVTNLDGEIYSLPKFQGKWPSAAAVGYINKVWLDNLGLEVPTTFSELRDVLIAFAEEDANGNGDPDDEYAFSMLKFFNGYGPVINMLGFLGIQLTDQGANYYFAEDGEIKSYLVDERFKLLVKYWADLYSHGVMKPELLTWGHNEWRAMGQGNEAGDALIGMQHDWDSTSAFGAVLYEQYVPLGPLEYDIDCEPGTYEMRYTYDFNACNVLTDMLSITTNCKDVEAALRFVDRLYDPVHSVEALFGSIAEGNIEQTGPNSFKVLPPQDPTMDSGNWKWSQTVADYGAYYIRRDTEIEMPQDMIIAVEGREPIAELIAKAEANKDDLYPQIFMKYTPEQAEEMALIETEVSSIRSNHYGKWLTGELDIDETWDAYVQAIYDAGLERALAIRQEVFDQYLGK